MKLVTFSVNGEKRLGAVKGDWKKWDFIVDLNKADPSVPADILSFIDACGELHGPVWEKAKKIVENAKTGYAMEKVKIHAPIMPRLLRDTIAFRGHIARTRAARGLPIAPEWDKLPAYYNGNHLNIIGSGDVPLIKFILEEGGKHARETQKLDYETEIAFIIGKGGKNVELKHAKEHLFGVTIFNDFSMRDLQLVAMGIGMGPAYGKDWCNAIGPCIVTMDEFGELESKKITTKVNGKERLSGTYLDLVFKNPFVKEGERALWEFEEAMEFISHSQEVYAGEVWGSGTVPGGCELERGAEAQFLRRGDVVEITVEGIGTLKNRIV
ncbi:MAG: fumarylacetoacetate hydrolase family protein [Candidatus Aenigmarchaeota archaeon]|nr:fumarylacetoacetate hydrolase family protein [Candidatus Aenigmarchaeota archaeon]